MMKQIENKMVLQKAIISAPFGTYIQLPGATSTRGTFTSMRRPGAIWGAFTRIDFPYPWESRGITNRMGMRNPGINSQNFEKYPDAIWSIYGFDYEDWLKIIDSVPKDATVELNFSCPNVQNIMSLKQITYLTTIAAMKFAKVIIKLPPNNFAIDLWDAAMSAGIRIFHCCNTLKTSKGGMSGRIIQAYSIPIVIRIKRESDAEVIIGGGIYTADDVYLLKNTGADYFSLGTIFMLYPWNICEVMAAIYGD